MYFLKLHMFSSCQKYGLLDSDTRFFNKIFRYLIPNLVVVDIIHDQVGHFRRFNRFGLDNV